MKSKVTHSSGNDKFTGATLALVFLESIEKDEMTRSDQECIEKSFLTEKSVCVVCRHVENREAMLFRG